MTSRRITSHLLAIESRKGSSEEGRIRAHPVLIAVLNLAACAYADHYLRNDAEGHYLSLFLFLECSMLVLIAIGAFMRSGIEILSKTSIFPTTSWSRLLFVLIEFLRKPASIALWLTTILFFIVVFYHSFGVVSMAVVLYALLVLSVLCFTAVVCLKLARSSQPLAGFAIVCVFVTIVILASSMIFHVRTLVASLPLLSWTAGGIIAAQRLQFGTALLDACSMLGLFLLLLFIGKRFA